MAGRVIRWHGAGCPLGPGMCRSTSGKGRAAWNGIGVQLICRFEWYQDGLGNPHLGSAYRSIHGLTWRDRAPTSDPSRPSIRVRRTCGSRGNTNGAHVRASFAYTSTPDGSRTRARADFGCGAPTVSSVHPATERELILKGAGGRMRTGPTPAPMQLPRSIVIPPQHSPTECTRTGPCPEPWCPPDASR